MVSEVRDFTDRFFGFPTEFIRTSSKYRKFSQAHPVRSAALLTPLAFMDGALKSFFFPLIALVGSIALPLIAIGEIIASKLSKSEEKSELWSRRAILHLKAGMVCMGATSALIAFAFISVYYLPVSAPIALLTAGVGASIAIHVYRVWRTPKKIRQETETAES